MLVNGDIFVFFPTYGQFAAIEKPDSKSIIYKV